MKRDLNFWLGLEEYLRTVARRSPLPYPWIAISIVLFIIFASFLNSKQSFAEINTNTEAALRAAKLGDYEVAQDLYIETGNPDLKDIVYPEQVVERRIAELEQKMALYPGNREIYIELSNLYRQLENIDVSGEYREKARVLDPNNLSF